MCAKFEDLVLRPAAGPCDVEAITAWLKARPFAFLDPVDDQTWHLSTNSESAAAARQGLLSNRKQKVWSYLCVSLFPDRVAVSVGTGGNEVARLLQFIVWLTREGAWMAKRDWGGIWEPLGDPHRLFTPGQSDPRDLDHDELLLEHVTEGWLLTWRDRIRGDFVAHSSGAWRFHAGQNLGLRSNPPNPVFRGFHTEEARSALAATIATVDLFDEPGMIQDAEDAPTTVAIEDAEGLIFGAFDPASPPASCRALTLLVVAWLDALEAWEPGGVIDGLASVRKSVDTT